MQAEGRLGSIRDCGVRRLVNSRRRGRKGTLSVRRRPRAGQPGAVQVGRRIETLDRQVDVFQTALGRPNIPN